MPNRQPLDVSSLDATLTHVRLPIGLTLDKVVVTGQGIHMDTEPFEFNLQKPGKLEVTVGAGAISAFLNTKAPKAIKDFEVAIGEGSMVVKATAKVVVTVAVHAECSLEIVDGKLLYVRLVSVGKLGSTIQKLVQNQLDDVNPVLDVDDLPLKAELSEVILAGGVVRIAGTILGAR